MSLLNTSSLLGREAIINFPDSTAQVRYSPQGMLLWTLIDGNGRISKGCERLSYLQLSDSLHFLNWVEKNGFIVSQVVDTLQGTVKACWSCAGDSPGTEPGTEPGATRFVVGRFRFC